MRAPGDILLVSCYELGHQPFHLATLLALFQQAGYSPTPIDTAVERLTDEAIAKARIVAISVPMHTALRLGQQVAQRVRSLNPRAHICFYGYYAWLNATYLLQSSADSIIGGEHEIPLLKLVVALEQDDMTPVVGVSTRQSSSRPWVQRMTFPVPQRRLLPPLHRYARLEVGGKAVLAGYTETSRGCKHRCLHCPITPVYNGHFFAIPAETVLADIRWQVEQGAHHITFGDPDFFNGPTHAMRVTRAMQQEFPEITFDATIKIEHVLKQRHLLPELKDLGCAFIVSAVESINDNVLRHFDKGHTGADVAEAFDLLERMGIPLRPSLLPFSPWETLESYIALLTFLEERNLVEHIDPVHFSIRLLVPPGSALLDAPGSQEWLDELDTVSYTYRWRHSDPRMDQLQHDVASLVEQAEQAHAGTIETFFHIKELAFAAAGQRLDISRAVEDYGTTKVVPHLTEAWFC
jgi:radical SAM superfamily enzyme YgiQ (UPF0313 family)